MIKWYIIFFLFQGLEQQLVPSIRGASMVLNFTVSYHSVSMNQLWIQLLISTNYDQSKLERQLVCCSESLNMAHSRDQCPRSFSHYPNYNKCEYHHPNWIFPLYYPRRRVWDDFNNFCRKLRNNAFNDTLNMGGTIGRQLTLVDLQNNAISSITLGSGYKNTLMWDDSWLFFLSVICCFFSLWLLCGCTQTDWKPCLRHGPWEHELLPASAAIRETLFY